MCCGEQPSCLYLLLAVPAEALVKVGGAKRDRTADLLNAIQALSQLSYSPMKCLQKEDFFICKTGCL
jgi:hypothetical protein